MLTFSYLFSFQETFSGFFPLPADKLRGRTAIPLPENSGKIQRIFIAAHVGNLANTAVRAQGGQQLLRLFHPQADQKIQG